MNGAEAVTGEALHDVFRAVRDVRDFSDIHRTRIHRAISWVKCADQQADDADLAFITLWIAFRNLCITTKISKLIIITYKPIHTRTETTMQYTTAPTTKLTTKPTTALRLLACTAALATAFAAPSALAGKGMLTITTDPGGAKIYINGKRKGTSPKEKGKSFAIKLDEGEYTVTAIGEKSYSPLWVNMGKEDDVFVGADSRQPLTLKVKWQLNPDLPAAQVQRMKQLMAITDKYRSRPSRKKDFVPQGNGTVLDKRTGLQWMRCSLGQRWTGSTCAGEPKKFNWEQAKAQRLAFAGKNDWRLPTLFELQTLVYCSSGKDNGRDSEATFFYLMSCEGDHQKPATVQQAFPNTGGSDKYPSYRSSSPNAGNSNDAWGVLFNYGYDANYDKDSSYYVRLVRGGQ